nr:MAG TPA: hypothetical protein [Bacteriophage sp.]
MLTRYKKKSNTKKELFHYYITHTIRVIISLISFPHS